MALSVRRRTLSEIVLRQCDKEKQQWGARALGLAFVLFLLLRGQSLAQMRPDVRDRVIPTAVQIVIHTKATEERHH